MSFAIENNKKNITEKILYYLKRQIMRIYFLKIIRSKWHPFSCKDSSNWKHMLQKPADKVLDKLLRFRNEYYI